MNFAALDFETADSGADSACQLGVVRVEDGRIVAQENRYIRPPRQTFLFTYIHGITWERVAKEKTFAQLWPELSPLFAGTDFLAAHNASFDRRVLETCCAKAGHDMPPAPFLCTVKLARRAWNLRPTKLHNVCDHLGLKLKHHDALSDALACANIVLAAEREGFLLQPLLS